MGAAVVDMVATGVEKVAEGATAATETVVEQAKHVGEMVGLTENKDEESKESDETKEESRELKSSNDGSSNNSEQPKKTEHKTEVIQMTGLPVNIEQSIRHEGE